MPKAMIFIDGTWLYANTPRLAESYGKKDFHIDFGKLPAVVANAVRDHLGHGDVDIVRTYLFGSYAVNCDPIDQPSVERRLDFYEMLREEHHYEVEIFPINFRGKRLRKADRDSFDNFEAKEKCVDISLATSMLYYAALPGAYDIAIAILGDQDFKPALQLVRRLGKRTAIVSIKGSCAEDLSDPTDHHRIKDFDIIWIDDLLPRLELRREPHELECVSPHHQGDRFVMTTYYPRRDQKFYCDICRAQHERYRQEQLNAYDHAFDELVHTNSPTDDLIDATVIGQVTALRAGDKGRFGFLRTVARNEYYFNPTNLEGDLTWDELHEGTPVQAVIARLPANGKAGAVRTVWRATHAMQNDTQPRQDELDNE